MVCHFFINILPLLYEKKLIGLFTHNFLLQQTNSQKIERIFNESLRKVLNNLLPLNLSTTLHEVLFLHRIAESVSPPNLYILVSSIHYFFYLTAALLKSDVFRYSKADSSHSFQPIGIELGSLRRGNRCVLLIIPEYL